MSYDQGFLVGHLSQSPHGSVLDLNKGEVGAASNRDIATENDKANDKLVDLVSVLTNKINKNVKEIQVDIIDHYEGNFKKLDDLEILGKERVEELIEKVEERRLANEVLKKKIIELQSKQADLQEKFSDLDENVSNLTKDHEQNSMKMEAKLKTHSQQLDEFEVKEEKINIDLMHQLEEINKNMKNSFDNLKVEIETTQTKINETINVNIANGKQNHDHVLGKFKIIHERLDEHSEKHKVDIKAQLILIAVAKVSIYNHHS